MRPLVLLPFLALAGCGTSPSEVRRAAQSHRCPASTPEFAPRHVLPQTPGGTSLVRADPKDAERYKAPFQQTLGKRLRSVRVGVVTERGEEFGTAVVVVNSTERMGDPRDVLRGAQANARPGAHPEEYTIAGRPGMISEESDGAIAAVAIANCAMVMLSGPDTPMVKRVAGHLRSPE